MDHSEGGRSFSEKLIRLPHSYQINDRSRPLPVSEYSRAYYNLPETGFVFCALNTWYKITPDIFTVWMKLLTQVKSSVLWLYEPSAMARANLVNEASKRGVDPERLIFAPFATQVEHLLRYKHADLFLDTSPVCGHTTASDALWCTVPVVTIARNSFASRVAAGLLQSVGLPELAVGTLKEYETLALDLAMNPARLKALKTHLEKGRMSFPLFDCDATTRALEAAYVYAAALHRNKVPPCAFALDDKLQVR